MILARRTVLQNIAALGLGLILPSAQAVANVTRTRLVCAGSAITEIVYELGAQQSIVGVDTTSLFPPAAQKLASIGFVRTLSVEGILSLSPSAILVDEDAGPPTVLRHLAAAGVPVHIIKAESPKTESSKAAPPRYCFEGMISCVEQTGRAIGRSTQATQLITKLRNRWQESMTKRMAYSKRPPPRVLILRNPPGKIVVAGKRTAADAMVRYAGAINVMDHFDGYKPLTPEAVVAARPDTILITEQGLAAYGGIDGVLKLPGMSQTPAGQRRRVVSQDLLLLVGFGPRLPKAVDQLITRLYQEPTT